MIPIIIPPKENDDSENDLQDLWASKSKNINESIKIKNSFVSIIIFLVILFSFVSKFNMPFIYIVIIVLVFGILISIKQINQYERGVRFTLGKYSGLMNPGWRLVIPIFQSYQKVDIRVKAVDVPDQETITKDNISTKVNAVIYYRVSSAEKVILEVQDFRYAVSQLAQTTMRNAVGEVELDELLSQREKVAEKIRAVVDKATEPWGIEVDSVELKDIVLPEEMKRVIGKQAEAEREKRSVIIRAEGEVVAAKNMAIAADTLSSSAGGLHLRTLATINDVSSDQSNTIIFAIPLEILKAFSGFNANEKDKK
ncbi:MAG: slipin family protein [Candidatus Paceibacterota bacterium]|jgi:regulator of protease activity HflC (stomatin/prohibitin superfamily)